MATSSTDQPRDYSYQVATGSRCLVLGGKPTLSQALADACELAMYYRLCCGYSELSILIQSHCATCRGEGKIPTLRRARLVGNYKRCPACKGKDSSFPVVSFPFQESEQTAEHIAELPTI